MNKAENKRTGLRLKPVIGGIAFGIAVIIVILLLGAVLISGEKLTEAFESTLICIAGFIGTACGGFLSAKKYKSAFMVNGIIVAVSMIIVRLIASVFSSDGAILDTETLKLMIFMLFGGIFGGLMAGKRKKKRKK